MTKPQLLSNPEIHDINNQITMLKSQLLNENQKLPSQKLYDISKLQIDIDTLEAQLTAHNDAKAKEQADKQELISKSEKILNDTLDELLQVADMLDEKWPLIHHLHRSRIMDLKNSLRQTLRGHTPTKQTKVKKEVA